MLRGSEHDHEGIRLAGRESLPVSPPHQPKASQGLFEKGGPWLAPDNERVKLLTTPEPTEQLEDADVPNADGLGADETSRTS